MSAPEKIFLVTGAASGIGRHLVHVLLGCGMSVVATDINAEALPRNGALNRKLDVTDPADWEKVLGETAQALGRIDVVLNVAGYLKPGWAHETESVEVHRHFDINVKGVVFGTQAAARLMVAQRSGHIINIASLAGLMPIAGISLYSASKYAVRGFSLAVAQELKAHGVHVSVVCPDAVRTPMLDLQKNYVQSAVTFSTSRVLSPDDVARVIFGRVLRDKPLEVFIPTARGWLGRAGDLFPSFAALATPVLQRIGLRHQKEYMK